VHDGIGNAWDRASWYEVLTFSWVSKLVAVAAKRSLEKVGVVCSVV
jgi:hypothetical protein